MGRPSNKKFFREPNCGWQRTKVDFPMAQQLLKVHPKQLDPQKVYSRNWYIRH